MLLSGQVDNPVAVMDQENSKKFLQGSETDKYRFFEKATELGLIKAVSSLHMNAMIEGGRIAAHRAPYVCPESVEFRHSLMVAGVFVELSQHGTVGARDKERVR